MAATISPAGKDDTQFMAVDDSEKCNQETKSDEDSSIKSNSKRSDNTIDRSLRSLAHLKQSFRPFSTPKKLSEKKPIDKDKNEPSKFFGDGVTFKAKLIGILEVEDARGDRMCQEALNELKMAVRAAGEHKQRINIVISIEGLRLRDEKTGDCLYHHPVHKISFIAQDVADSRAFGYIFGSPDTGHKFFGIKTDKSASQVVIAMRDLFQVVFELKKREVEVAKHSIEQHQLKYGASYLVDIAKAGIDFPFKPRPPIKEDNSSNMVVNKTLTGTLKNKTQTAGVIADLMDLELELNSLQQGLSQMERITPSDPFGSSTSASKDDPFGDSFTPPVARTPPPAKLPPPPTSGDRKKTAAASSSSSMQSELHWFDKETQKLFDNDISSPSVQSASSTKQKAEDSQQQVIENSTYKASKDLFDIFTELDPLGTGKIKPYVDKKDFFQELKNPPKKTLKDLGGSENDAEITGNGCAVSFSGSVENNSSETTTGTGAGTVNFQNDLNDSSVSVIKEETKIQNNLISDGNSFQPTFADFTAFENLTQQSHEKNPMKFPLIQSDSSSSQSSGHGLLKSSTIVPEKNAQNTITEYHIPPSLNSVGSHPLSSTSDGNKLYWRPSSANNNSSGKEKIVINLRRVLSAGDDTDKENDSPVREDGIVLRNPDAISPAPVMASSDSFESIPEPPPRPITSPVSTQQPPPPLPPKKVHVPVTMKPPARPPSSSETVSHYDYIENYESLSGSKQKFNNNNRNEDRSGMKIPPIPAPARKSRFSYDSDLDFARKRPQQQQYHHHQKLASCSSSSTEYYLTPIASKKDLKRSEFESNTDDGKITMPPLDMTLKQLTCADFNEIAAILGIDANLLPRMTLKDLADRLSASTQPSSSGCPDKENFTGNNRRSKRKTGDTYTSLKESFDDEFVPSTLFQQGADKKMVKEFTDSKEHGNKMDKYAVFRELMEQEEKTPTATTGAPQISENSVTVNSTVASVEQMDNGSSVDRYAALRDICPSPALESNENENNEDNRNENVEKNEDDNSVKGSDKGNNFNNEEEYEEVEEEEEEEVIAAVDGAVDKPNKDAEKIAKSDDRISTSEISDVKQQSRSTENVEAEAMTKETNEKDEEESSLPPIEREDNSFSKNWTKFESNFVELSSSFEQKPTSPWSSENAVAEKSFGGYSPEEEVRKRMNEIRVKNRYRQHKQQQQQRWGDNDYYNDDDEDEDDYDDDEDYGDDDSEENWESSRRSLASSWDESSWKENGWSDRDSLYEEKATASPTFKAANHRNRYQVRRKGACHRRRYSPTQQHTPPPPPVTTRKQFSPWADEDKNQLTTGKAYKMQSKYKGGSSTQSSSWYNSRKVVSPPFYRHSPPPLTEEEQFEILKMMLGKKRFKELGGKIFKKYLTNELASTSYMAKNDDYNEYDEPAIRTKSKSGRKYYHLNRPKSAESKTGAAARRQQCSPSEDLYQGLKYRKPPYSHDELSVSEDEDKKKWRRKQHPLPPYYCETRAVPSASGRSNAREHSQTSPFEDNFSPPPDCLPSSSYDKPSAVHHRHNIGSSLFTLRLCSPESPASSTNARHHYSGKDLYPPPQPASSSSCYSPQHELKLSRSSRGSSQRQSPFEDDFSSPEVTAQQRIKDGGSTTKQRHNTDGANPAGGTCSNIPAYSISAEQQQAPPARNVRSNDVFCRMSPPQQEWLKQHYENVDIKKQSPEMFYYDKPTRTHSGKESSRYKSFASSAVGSSPSSKELENDGSSPKKFFTTARKQQHMSNPFNDGPHHSSGHSQSYESKTASKSQKMKIKQTKLPSDYDSGSDSVGMTPHPPTVAGAKWKEDFNSAFNFPDHQRNK